MMIRQHTWKWLLTSYPSIIHLQGALGLSIHERKVCDKDSHYCLPVPSPLAAGPPTCPTAEFLNVAEGSGLVQKKNVRQMVNISDSWMLVDSSITMPTSHLQVKAEGGDNRRRTSTGMQKPANR